LQFLDEPLAAARSVRLAVARLDLLDSVISGNKWFKLRHNLEQAQQQGYKRILSFGGPWSNHIHALAWAGDHLGFDTLAIIRGYQSLPDTAMLRDARGWGMAIHFVGHGEYRLKTDERWLSQLQNRFGDCYVVPEGGCNAAGIEGCKAILDSVVGGTEAFTTAVTAVGTGATLAGLLQAPNGVDKILGVSVLKGDGHARQRVAQLLPQMSSQQLEWDIDSDHHFGGYARVNDTLLAFIEGFYQRHGIALEPVYTGKMFYALFQRLEAGWFAPGENILAIHSGGMQGLRGYADKWPWAASQLARGLDKS
jgi:1-aminocyclopropane-1-carboxylate deaminase